MCGALFSLPYSDDFTLCASFVWCIVLFFFLRNMIKRCLRVMSDEAIRTWIKFVTLFLGLIRKNKFYHPWNVFRDKTSGRTWACICISCKQCIKVLLDYDAATLESATIQKNSIWIFSAVKISNSQRIKLSGRYVVSITVTNQDKEWWWAIQSRFIMVFCFKKPNTC